MSRSPLALSLVLILAACSGQRQEPAPPPPTITPPADAPQPARTPPPTATAEGCAIGEPCAVDDLTVTVTAIEDSRCPANARCIQAGDAAVTLTVGEKQATLHTNEATGVPGLTLDDGRSLVLIAVEPFPGLGDDSAPKRAAFHVNPAKPASTLPY